MKVQVYSTREGREERKPKLNNTPHLNSTKTNLTPGCPSLENWDGGLYMYMYVYTLNEVQVCLLFVVC